MQAFAPAKVNLFLHVGAPGSDGYHPLCSLMVFANVGDRLVLQPAGAKEFSVKGPFAPSLGDLQSNLVIRARDALMEAAGSRDAAFALTLHKTLPIASGLGGGSSDAAAALRLVNASLGLNIPQPEILDIARSLGADVPACVLAQPVIATGRGDQLAGLETLPDLDAVLVNPGEPSPTGAVFRAYDRFVSPAGANAPGWPRSFRDPSDVISFLSGTRNDLQDAAVALTPVIGQVLEALSKSPETLFARMSGSGATCFALCESPDAARSLAGRISHRSPKWWVRACRLGRVDLETGQAL